MNAGAFFVGVVDFDDVGAELGERAAGGRAREDLGEVQDADAVEGAARVARRTGLACARDTCGSGVGQDTRTGGPGRSDVPVVTDDVGARGRGASRSTPPWSGT